MKKSLKTSLVSVAAAAMFPMLSMGNDTLTINSPATYNGVNLTLGATEDLIIVGDNGTGSLTFTNGATLKNSSNNDSLASIVLGHNGGTGTLTMNGSSVTLNPGIPNYDPDVHPMLRTNFYSNGNGLARASLVVGGTNGSGTADLSNNSTLNVWGVRVGRDNGSTGNLSLTGGSQVTMSDSFVSGWYGNGTTTISGGSKLTADRGYVSFQSGSGVVTVTGNGSELIMGPSIDGGFLSVGRAGSGELTVSNQGKITTDEELRLGANAGSFGKMTLQDTGSQAQVGTIVYVAGAGQAELEVKSGATMTADSLIVGSSAGGKGWLEISGGSSFSGNSGASRIGSAAGSKGFVTVTGSNSTLDLSSGASLSIGHSGQGRLDVRNGGEVEVASANINLGVNAGSRGLLEVAGSNSKVKGASISIGNSVGTSNATVFIRGGGQVETTGNTTNTAYIRQNGTLLIQPNASNPALKVSTGLSQAAGSRLAFFAYDLNSGNYTAPITLQNNSTPVNYTGSATALGGTWNGTTSTFTASSVVTGSNAINVSINIDNNQRLDIDSSDGDVWIDFSSTALSTSNNSTLNFMATRLNPSILPYPNVGAAWQFDTDMQSGYLTLVSMQVDSAFVATKEIQIVRSIDNNVTWSFFTDDVMIDADSNRISFLTDGFSSFAVVPEPSGLGTLALLALTTALLRHRRRARSVRSGF